MTKKKDQKQLINAQDVHLGIDFDSGTLQSESNLGVGYTALYFEGKSQKYFHPYFGEFEFNEAIFEAMIANFESGAYGQDIAINYSHDKGGKAAGWVKRMYIEKSGNKTELKLDIDFTPAGAEAVRNKEFRYFSAEFSFPDKPYPTATGKKLKNVFTGGALTNIPFLKSTDVSLSEEEGKVETMDKDQLIKELKEAHGIDLASIQHSNVSLEAAYAKQIVDLNEAKASLVEKSEKLEALEKELTEKEREALFSIALDEGKTCPALKEEFFYWIEAVGLSDAKEKLASRPVLFSTKQQSVETQKVKTDKEVNLSDPEQLNEAILSYMAENKIANYSDAYHSFMTKKENK